MNDVQLHQNSLYLNEWNKINNKLNLHKLAFYNKNIKLRLFSYTYHQLFSYKSVITPIKLDNYHSLNLWYKQLDQYLIFETLYNIKITGYYKTNTHLVLCSIPHAKILINSYYNNPKDTINKLQKITSIDHNNAQNIINLARELIA